MTTLIAIKNTKRNLTQMKSFSQPTNRMPKIRVIEGGISDAVIDRGKKTW